MSSKNLVTSVLGSRTHNSQMAQTTQVSTSGRLGKQNHGKEPESAVKHNSTLTGVPTWETLKITPSGINRAQKHTYCTMPSMCSVQNGHIPTFRKEMSGCWGLEGGLQGFLFRSLETFWTLGEERAALQTPRGQFCVLCVLPRWEK